MDAYLKVANKLQELGITFDVVEHPPAFTTEQADSYIEGMEGVRTKSMFLTNKKKTQYYLLIMDDKKSLDMDLFKELVSANRIRMASADSLYEKMQLPPGTVSPFGLLNNEEKDIQVYFAGEEFFSDLKKEIAEGRFREDLYHRLAVILIRVPSLNERRDDIPLLIDYFSVKIAEEQGISPKKFSKKAVELLQKQDWTGNIRELRNVVERLIILGGKEISEDDVKAFAGK